MSLPGGGHPLPSLPAWRYSMIPGAFQPAVPEVFRRGDAFGELLDACYGIKDVVEICGVLRRHRSPRHHGILRRQGRDSRRSR
mgnify:CR=1 FL=1